MSDKKDDTTSIEVFVACERGHLHPVGTIEGVFRPNGRGEVVYEDKNSSSVGYSGNPRFSKNYDQMDWN